MAGLEAGKPDVLPGVCGYECGPNGRLTFRVSDGKSLFGDGFTINRLWCKCSLLGTMQSLDVSRSRSLTRFDLVGNLDGAYIPTWQAVIEVGKAGLMVEKQKGLWLPEKWRRVQAVLDGLQLSDVHGGAIPVLVFGTDGDPYRQDYGKRTLSFFGLLAGDFGRVERDTRFSQVTLNLKGCTTDKHAVGVVESAIAQFRADRSMHADMSRWVF